MNRVIAIPQGITPGGPSWPATGGGAVSCTNDATVHVAPMLAGGYSRVQLCGAFIPTIAGPPYIPAPVICLSTIKGSVLGVVATGHTVSGLSATFAFASGSNFDLYLVDPMSQEKIPFASIDGNIVISLQFQ